MASVFSQKIERQRLLFWASSVLTFLLMRLFVGPDWSTGTLGILVLQSLGVSIPIFYPPPLDFTSVVITALFLTWPQLVPRSSLLAAVGSFLVSSFALCLIPPLTAAFPTACKLGWGYLTFPGYWTTMVVVYGLRKHLRKETWVYGALLALAQHFVYYLMSVLGIVLMYISFAFPLMSLGWVLYEVRSSYVRRQSGIV